MMRALRVVCRAALLAVIAAAVCIPRLSEALQINLNFVAGAANPNDPGNASLRAITRAAADLWQELIEDTYTMTVDISYYTYDTMGNGDCAIDAIACAGVSTNNSGGFRTNTGTMHFLATENWYYDPTPYDHGEFDFSQKLYNQLSDAEKTAGFGGVSPHPLLEVGYLGADNASDPNVAGKVDLLTTALHEIGHLLGVTNQIPAARFETLDGDYDIGPAFLNGADMSVKAAVAPTYAHLVSSYPVMTGDPAVNAVRQLPSAADLFAVASVGRWSQINLERLDYLSTTSSSWVTGNNWEGYRLPGSFDFVAVRHGGTANIHGASVVVGEVLVDNNSTVSVTDGLLLTDRLTLRSTGSLSLTGGEVRVRDGALSAVGKTLGVAGQTTPTLSLIDGARGDVAGIAVGGFVNAGPGLFLPAPGRLLIESGALMHATGNIVLGNGGPAVGHGIATIDGGRLFVDGSILLALLPSSQFSELDIRGDGFVSTTTVNALTPTSRVRVSSGKLLTKNLVLPTPDILQHSGGEIQINGGAYNRLDERLSGTGNPLLRFTGGAVGATRGLAVGGVFQPTPGLFLPETGELRVESNSTVTTTGNVILGGVGPNAGHGVADVNGGTWNVSGAITLAPQPTATSSRLTVRTGSTLTADTIQAFTPTALIDIIGGNTTLSNLIVPAPGIIRHAGGSVTVDGGNYTNPSATISGTGSPVLRLINGAVGTTGNVQLGGFLTVPPGVYLPESGELRVESTSTLNTTGNVLLGANSPALSGPGRAVLDDGVWNVSGDVVFSVSPTIELSELTIRNNSYLTARTVQALLPTSRIRLIDGGLYAQSVVAPAASFEFSGGELNLEAFTGPLIQNGGRVTIGYLADELQVTGSYVQNAGSLDIELFGANSAGVDYDLLSISGAASLAGELQVSLVAGFTPTLGDRFEFLTAMSGVTGRFSSVVLPSLSPGLSWRLDYSPDRVALLVMAINLPGDYNDDGVVDAADYTVWRDNLGSPAGTLLNDIDGGAIGAAQYDTWRANYGATLAGALSSAVPEPSTVVILAAAVGLAGAIRRARNR